MRQAKFQSTNDFYMYQFRTKLCCKKDTCWDEAACIDAHSSDTKRRMPKINEETGEFNYIPKPCPEWSNSEICSMGEDCPRSHGWLEMIYHPLLYKTKLCKSKRKNGVCIAYGFYCAKAHSRSEIRSLVNIFGEDWKRYYDLTWRDGFNSVDVIPGFTDVSTKSRKNRRMHVGLATAPKSQEMLDVNLFAYYLLEKQAADRNGSRNNLDCSVETDLWSDWDDDFEDLDTYALESEPSNSWSPKAVNKSPFDKHRNEYVGFTDKCDDEPWSQCTESSTLVVPDFLSPVHDNSESPSWVDNDWRMLCGEGSPDDQRTMSYHFTLERGFSDDQPTLQFR